MQKKKNMTFHIDRCPGASYEQPGSHPPWTLDPRPAPRIHRINPLNGGTLEKDPTVSKKNSGKISIFGWVHQLYINCTSTNSMAQWPWLPVSRPLDHRCHKEMPRRFCYEIPPTVVEIHLNFLQSHRYFGGLVSSVSMGFPAPSIPAI